MDEYMCCCYYYNNYCVWATSRDYTDMLSRITPSSDWGGLYVVLGIEPESILLAELSLWSQSMHFKKFIFL